MTLKSLGNVVPTAEERQKMFEILEGLRARPNFQGSNFAVTYNEAEDTVELQWTDERGPWGKGWVTAWIDGLCKGRMLLVWRHPSYRYGSDDRYIYENSKTRNLGSS